MLLGVGTAMKIVGFTATRSMLYLLITRNTSMSVGTQMQQAIDGIQSASATMKTFSLETEDEKAKNDFEQSVRYEAKGQDVMF